MQIELLQQKLNSIFPANTAMPNDPIGIQIQPDTTPVDGVLVTLEVTDEVIDECLNFKFNTILTFHPLIYSKLSAIIHNERVGYLCSKLIKNSIKLISIHTTFDVYRFGTSRILADKLELKTVSFLVNNSNNDNVGMGIVATSTKDITALQLVQKVYDICGGSIRYSGDTSKYINKVAIVGGSGTSFLSDVVNNKCDCFITADVTYHRFHEFKDSLFLIDVGHYEMEQFVPEGITTALADFFNKNKIRFECSKINTNPINYYNKYSKN